MIYKKLVLVALCSTMLGVFAADHHQEKPQTREQMESALRAMAVGVVSGFSSNLLVPNATTANLAGVVLSGSANILVGEFAFKDRNYKAQIAGWLFGYVLGAVLGNNIKENSN